MILTVFVTILLKFLIRIINPSQSDYRTSFQSYVYVQVVIRIINCRQCEAKIRVLIKEKNVIPRVKGGDLTKQHNGYEKKRFILTQEKGMNNPNHIYQHLSKDSFFCCCLNPY